MSTLGNDIGLDGGAVLLRGRQAETAAPSPGRLMRMLLALAENLRTGTLTVVMPDGSARRFAGPVPGPDAVLTVHSERVARRLLIGGTLAFCEAYIDGDWSSPDIGALFELMLRNQETVRRVQYGRGWYRSLRAMAHQLRPNSRRGSRRNIAYHYDLGNAFYARWLDPSMTYSAALFADPSAPEDLQTAQTRKYAEIARRLDLRPGHNLLEIGCGWGGFAEYAADTIGARVTAITISREQYTYARDRIARAGLSDRVDIRLTDYRDIDGAYDRIASIEMFEAVGEAYWPAFFRTLHARLKPGGRAALQVITIDDRRFPLYRNGSDFIQQYIFPGGMLPSRCVLRRAVERAGLAWRGADAFGPHYARTLAEWQRRFQAAWPELTPLGFDDRFKRMWELYLHYCEAGFKLGPIDVLQVALSRD